MWWHTSLIPALGRQRQTDLCEFKTSLVYRASMRTARAFTQRNPVLKNKIKTNRQKHPHSLRAREIAIGKVPKV